MSARERLAKADELFEEALGIEDDPSGTIDPPPVVTRVETLLRALVQAQLATASAVIEAIEEHGVGVHHAPMPARPMMGSETRPYAGGC